MAELHDIFEKRLQYLDKLSTLSSKLEQANSQSLQQIADFGIAEVSVRGGQSLASAFVSDVMASPTTTPTEREVMMKQAGFSITGGVVGYTVGKRWGPIGSLIGIAVGTAAGEIAGAITGALYDKEVAFEKEMLRIVDSYTQASADLGSQITEEDVVSLIKYYTPYVA